MMFWERTRQSQNICIAFVQRRPNVFNVGPTLYKCYTNVLCFLGMACKQLETIFLSIQPPCCRESDHAGWKEAVL